ncbi:P-loop containing nucleoside triphosphate hydrolase [Lasallia pustulata]|uniref:p-loop containing nucleoside triphosphate hydrolase n=1 Tax=Lasallia pustulata TaxID=136370 RepID=A0A1W5CVV3_9LECA|nr:P-loop containing nucleoside triphosphate hydrolase [Lasallia pustulata]
MEHYTAQWKNVPSRLGKSNGKQDFRTNISKSSSVPMVSNHSHRRNAMKLNMLNTSPGLSPVDMNRSYVMADRDVGLVNEDTPERFSRSTVFQTQDIGQQTPSPRPAVDLSIREYMRALVRSKDAISWLGKREIPSSAEIMGITSDDGNGVGGNEIGLTVNKIDSPWDSKEQYLEAHYELAREDAVAPLRDVVAEVKNDPNLMERDSTNNAAIYEKASYTLTQYFTAFDVEVGKRVIWEQSKRLITGTMVALTPAEDMFKEVCRVAVVAARPLAGVSQNPPEIDIFFADPEDFEIDPQQEWVMVEARVGFPMSEHLMKVEKEVSPPVYVAQQPLTNLSSALSSETDKYLNVDVLNAWPENPPSELDDSQLAALQRIMTKRLAIVQGPPGTGKTHVSVVALKALLQNMTDNSPPIIIAAHTNHAVDQILRHVAAFEPGFIRLGGRSLDLEIIKPRTLYEIRKNEPLASLPGGLQVPAHKAREQSLKSMKSILSPLVECGEPFPAALLLDLKIISQAQHDSLEKGALEWVRVGQGEQVNGAVAVWLGSNLIVAGRRTQPEDYGVEVEEIDLEFEQLKELEAESKASDEDDSDTLKGPRVALLEPFSGRQTRIDNSKQVDYFLKKQDLWSIPGAYRGAIYRSFQEKVKSVLLKKFRAEAKIYTTSLQDLKIGNWERDSLYLRKARIIGMTTTGLSKYRGLVASVKPRVVFIEEAAETLEAYLTAACFDSLEHLVLVGDHQQLRGHCSVKDLEGYPFYLDVSMFERLIKNGVEFSQLTRQRRMVPEVRRLLNPIYKNLDDHPSVLERLPVPGMGGVNSYFFTHDRIEQTDNQMSKYNQAEADMIVGFFDYLVHNGMEAKDITVLTFYNSQRKLLLRGLRNHANLQGCYFKVVTVDSYQGEENGVVLLSLVRSNAIGFLSVENRVCVSLSRAQRGFYIFGNAPLLFRASSLWRKVLDVMSSSPNRVGSSLPITCKNHDSRTLIQDALSWSFLNGGCDRACNDVLPCGHTCELRCHPFPHDLINCHHRCEQVLPCGHQCIEPCYLRTCKCTCIKGKGHTHLFRTHSPKNLELEPFAAFDLPPDWPPATPRNNHPPNRFHGHLSPPKPRRERSPPRSPERGTELFRDFAQGGHVGSDARLDRLLRDEEARERQRVADEAMARALFVTCLV